MIKVAEYDVDENVHEFMLTELQGLMAYGATRPKEERTHWVDDLNLEFNIKSLSNFKLNVIQIQFKFN